ncbi:DEAD/DEAH box helicase family protein [Brevundimonas diminuta]|uniref:DEAD/DEAH box helicase n=1 Tax=Brevundimonas diminuta TaxID=293 RepID=UPI0022AF7502|nr:DEAD/DEAH box helicase family protein [Brevundimonas diminuta]MCZ4109584.1 DEAD/DEAH box helicase family protein [Brevundimonas diminuta]
MNFENFLTRADDETLQQLLGTKVLRLLRALDPKGFNQGRQRALVLEQTRPQALLADKAKRLLLLDLLRPAEAAQLCHVLGLAGSDSYAALAKTSFTGARFNALLEFFELSPLVVEDAPLSPPTRLIQPAHALFAHQEVAAQKCLTALNEGDRRVLLHMPTGAGKTRTATHIISSFLRANPGKAVVWLAHSEELCEQAAVEFEKAWTNLGSRPLKVHRYWGGRDLDLADVDGGFVVVGLGKMNAAVRRSIGFVSGLGAKAGLVVMDEAHQAIAPTYQLILDALADPFPQTGLLGLSATPGRTWNDVDADERLAAFFRRRKVTLKVEGYDNPVDYLVHEGYLAKAKFRPLVAGSQTELSDEERQRLEEELEIPADVLERLALDERRNLSILAEIESLAKRHRRIIVFSTTVEHADLLAYTLRARGLWARSVTGATEGQERRSTLETYKDDAEEPRIICNFGVLTTGFDAPKTSAAVIARPTVSLVLYSQMVGRATRGVKAGGNAQAEIVTVVDSGLPGFGDVGEAFYNWEDVWGEA